MEPAWSAPHKQMQIQKGHVHLWRATLDLPIRDVRFYAGALSDDERMKAGRFRFDRDRNRYTVSFGILKSILGLYIGVEPGAVRISYGNRGKPKLSSENGKSNIHFNLSHSEELAIYVFALDYEVGVDMERIRDFPEMERIVEDYFSPPEKNYYKALPKSKGREVFFRLWTRKEAYIKAIGEGLYHPLNRFEVSLIPAESSTPIFLEGGPMKAFPWLIQDLEPAPEFAGAFAVKNRSWIVHYWQCTDLFIRNLELNRPGWR